MAKISHVLPDDWLATYIRNYVVDTLAPSERMQFRMACGRGAEAVAEWADATLPKYTSVWRRLKSAQRQRRFRAVPSTEKWMTDWKAAERTLGKHITATLRRNRATLGQATSCDTGRNADRRACSIRSVVARGAHVYRERRRRCRASAAQRRTQSYCETLNPILRFVLPSPAR